MFHALSGSKAVCGDVKLLVVREFNEWRVMILSSDAALMGTRQFDEQKAKDHAVMVAKSYLEEVRHADASALSGLEWKPTDHDDWMVWRG